MPICKYHSACFQIFYLNMFKENIIELGHTFYYYRWIENHFVYYYLLSAWMTFFILYWSYEIDDCVLSSPFYGPVIAALISALNVYAVSVETSLYLWICISNSSLWRLYNEYYVKFLIMKTLLWICMWNSSWRLYNEYVCQILHYGDFVYKYVCELPHYGDLMIYIDMYV